MTAENRFNNYDNPHCWQYQIRLNNLESDLLESGLTTDEVESLSVKDFEFSHVPKENKQACKEIKEFIIKHEWLGKMSLYPTHYFTATYNGVLAGVIVMDMPITFSKLLGENTRRIEKLISRGACISWSPKNLASSLLMWSIKWMVNNTRRRVFTAYSDPEAKELGTIYQACNFHYLGQQSGVIKKYKLPDKDKWVSDRYFRSRSVYKRMARNNGITWQDGWQNGDKILWDNIPDELEMKIRSLSKDFQNSCEYRTVKPKHKYMYILGKDKRETRYLLRQFRENSPKLFGLEYPKNRGE